MPPCRAPHTTGNAPQAYDAQPGRSLLPCPLYTHPTLVPPPLPRARPPPQFLRLRSKKHEIMIAPEFEAGHEYTLVVVQDPKAD